jgi:hypothetical protein
VRGRIKREKNEITPSHKKSKIDNLLEVIVQQKQNESAKVKGECKGGSKIIKRGKRQIKK